METTQETLEAWHALESYVPDRIRSLGISNISLEELQELFQAAKIKPSVVQNRFYRQTDYDVKLRKFCHENDITYESFWTLTANRNLLRSDVVSKLTEDARLNVDKDGAKEVALYALVMGLGMAVLNGTTNLQTMKGDLEKIKQVEGWAKSNKEAWEAALRTFENGLLR